jgi:hypothetical protein
MQLVPWTRKHDKPGTPVIPQAPSIQFPQSLEDLICICSTRPDGQRLHAAGSHWALSRAAISDHSFIETHDYNNLIPAMGRTLYTVVPGCLSAGFLNELQSSSTTAGAADPGYFVHFEAGKRIYQLYAELDVGDSANPNSLCALMKSQFDNSSFEGSWAFPTLGGSGGQTVVGAFSTGTHGGDFDRPPIADAVVALHLVADGGKHYWIERDQKPRFTDVAKLRALYGAAEYRGPGNFEVIYDNEVLYAAMVQVGRFGAIYSAVIQVTRQYGLRQGVVLDTWENVQGLIANPNSSLFGAFTMLGREKIPQRFLQIVVCPIPNTNGTTHACSITRHWTLPLAQVPPEQSAVNWSAAPENPAGRPERVGNMLPTYDPLVNTPRFANAGNSVGFSSSGPSFLNLACADANFMDGIINGIYNEIENFLSNNSVAIGGALAAAIAEGLLNTLLDLVPWLLLLLATLATLLNVLRSAGSTLGQVLNNLRSSLLGSSNPLQRAAGIIVWRAIANAVFQSQQSPGTTNAISYAILDGWNYTDLSCSENVRSMEVFFDAADQNLIAFVNRLLQFEIDQEFQSGLSVAGYISLRFCGQSNATIAPQPFPRTCAIECSGLADELGSSQFVDYAIRLALDPNIKGILHWGQENKSTQAEVEFRFGDTPANPTGALQKWRSVLARLTDNGRLDGFSSDFTRRTGLEVVQPLISSFKISSPPSASNHSCTLTWNCSSNPPGTTVNLGINPPTGSAPAISGLPLSGSYTVAATQTGTYIITLIAGLDRNGENRNATQALTVTFP